MRLISYNIKDGGAGRESYLREVIAAQRADVVGLVEAEDPAIVESLAAALGMDFILAEGNSHASALLSRFPIGDTVNHALLHPMLSRSCLEAHVTDDQGNDWPVVVTQLHAGATEADEAQREQETSVLLRLFATWRMSEAAHILCGDFNANSPVQQIDPALCKPATRDAWHASGGELPRRVVTNILDAGYMDSLQRFDPASARTRGTFSTEHPGQRVDYIFLFGAPSDRVKSAWIDQSEPARAASDHFPIGAEFGK